MKKPIKSVWFVLSLLPAIVFPLSNFGATALAADASIIWNPNSESDLDGYAVYMSTGSSGPPYTFVEDLFLDEIVDLNNPEVTLTQLQEGVNYYFVVTAYDNSGNESRFSNAICLKIENSSIIDCTAASDPGASDGGDGGGGSGGGVGCFISTLAGGHGRENK